MDDLNTRSLDGFENELCALNIPECDRAEIIGAVRAKVAEASLGRVGAPHDPKRVATARRIQRLRLCGNQIMGANIMRDPKFEMMLELYVAHHEHRRVSVSTLCAATTAPQTTGLRHIEALERQGFLTRTDDWTDARRCWILGTGKALSAVDRFLEEHDRGLLMP